MSKTRPLTSQEIDDGWCLEEALPTADEPYLEYTVRPMTDEEFKATSSGFQRAFHERGRAKQRKRRAGKASMRFSNRRKKSAKHSRMD